MTTFRFYPSMLLAISAVGALTACEAAVPRVNGQEFVLPSRAPNKIAQALAAPSTSDADADVNANAYCAGGGVQTRNESDIDGSFVTEMSCEPGGGIASFRNVGVIDPDTGIGAYDQTTIYEDGSESVYSFVVRSIDAFTQEYDGTNASGTRTSHSVYALDGDETVVDETWNTAEGTYVISGRFLADGSWHGSTTFDDPATTRSPDYNYDEVRGADGTSSQVVHFENDDYSSDYTYSVHLDGSSDYDFATDLNDTLVAPDFEGGYGYNADGSGEGGYTQTFADGSLMLVTDVIRADGSQRESWSFNDSSTAQDIDQEGVIELAVDGSGEGTVTTFVLGGSTQTCQVHIVAGVSTIDNCS